MKKNVFLLAFIMLQSVSALYAAEKINKNKETGTSIDLSNYNPEKNRIGDVIPWSKMISNALTNALENIQEGSRVAINKLKFPNGWSKSDKSDTQDEIIEILTKEGYKVVAKNYLEKLYEEQKSQQSGIYNEKTTVKTNNFSAIGYYINITIVDEEYGPIIVRAQIINVSTGEIDGVGRCLYGGGSGLRCE